MLNIESMILVRMALAAMWFSAVYAVSKYSNVFPLCAVGVMGAKPGVVAVDL